VELAGFGLSLEQPTVMEQTINSAAKISALVFFPHAKDSRVPANFLIELKRVMVVTSCCWAALEGSAGRGP
jgi:hypothetical protein